MSPKTLLQYALINGLALGVGTTVAVSCVDVEYPTVAFRCSPRQPDNCPESHFCCSDDPAAEQGQLPDLQGRGIAGAGVAFFAGNNNALGTTGMCVRVEDIPSGAGLQEANAFNCPIPCNPTWSDADVTEVCGDNRVCCQTVELGTNDCVADPDTNEIRPVTGADISGGLTRWAPGDHDTHQSPNGSGCEDFASAAGDPSSDAYQAAFNDCVSQLSVADQRGFCLELSAGESCPTDRADFVDACTALANGVVEG